MKKANNQSELKKVRCFISVMQAFTKDYKKLQKPKSNKYIQKDFNTSRSEINQY